VVRVAVGYRRTGLCPTFAQPTLQRDGYLLRVPLVGGQLDLDQVECLADVARHSGNGMVELTNRGNLQLRGLAHNQLAGALAACRALGLGDAGASLVTISPFAGVAEHQFRDALVGALGEIDTAHLSHKFAVHVDDADRTTADRSADMRLALSTGGGCEVTVSRLGTTTCASVAEAADVARRLAECCIQHGPHARPADIVASTGTKAFAEALGATTDWLPARSARRSPPPEVGVTLLLIHPAERPQVGGASPESQAHLAVAAAKFGRINGSTLAAIARLLRQHQLAKVRVTPWRTFAFSCSSAAQAAAVLADAALVGLLTDVGNPALGVIACIGSTGCWQTQLDTLAEAERFVANRPADIQPGALVHVSGCDKFCATRAPVTLTFVGRADSSGFEVL
jgi:precorrin-3B synthase